MKSTPSLMPEESALACSSPVRTCALAGSNGSMFAVSSLGRDPFVGGQEDRVELALLVEQLLRRGEVEDGERGAAERLHVTQPRDARDGELLGGTLGRGADPVADRPALVLGRALVDHHLRGAGGPLAVHEPERVEAVGVAVEAEPERGGLAVAGRLALRRCRA